ncbi:MAG TPA: aryl-sulfate sulfotransferase [Myxococcota bacterium]|nr:aryl-sulfate sulfotransferase [Myxococcota bacterium]
MFLLFLACTPTPVPTLVPVPEQAAAELSWSTDQPGIGWIEYSYPGSPPLQSRPESVPRQEHQFLLVGIPGGVVGTWRAAWEEEGEVVTSDWQTWSPPLFENPAEPPRISIATNDDPGYLMLPDRAQQTLWILGPDGAVVWALRLDSNAYIERARLVGNQLWHSYTDGNDNAAGGRIGSIGLDGSNPTDSSIPHHHDFLAFPDRLVYLKRFSTVGADDVVWAADELVERVDGVERPLWNSVEGGALPEMHGDKAYDEGIDWTHCNGLAWDSLQEAYWLSCKHQEAIFVISREAELLGIVGGPASTSTLQGDGFGEIHAPYVTDDRLYVFNNSRGNGHGPRGEVYVLDRGSQSYQLESSHDHPGAETQVFGNVTPTQSGGQMVSFGLAGFLELVNPKGKMQLQVKTDGLGYVEYLPALSGPIE